MGLKFAEFWMLMFFVVIGCYGGQARAEYTHYKDIGVGVWLGAIIGLAFGVTFMLPISNGKARENMVSLLKKLSSWTTFCWMMWTK